MAQSPFNALQRLARKILEGDVVFFIGAGFSLDSEGNSAERQIKRLLIRLLSFIRALDSNTPDNSKLASTLLGSFQQSFGLKGRILETGANAEVFPFLKSDVRRLTERYFEANDWFCDAYTRLLVAGGESWNSRLDELCALVAKNDEDIRTKGGVKDDEPGLDGKGKHNKAKDLSPPLDTVPLRPMDEELFAFAAQARDGHQRAAGKALFLDTMGFQDSEIMAGAPSTTDLDKVASSYVGKLLPRHHVIARLAREGLCTTTITTNFDLLLDGAFRLAGFAEARSMLQLPHTTYNLFARIASADAFFTEGKPHRTSVLVKMHGCTERYRQARALKDPEALKAFLRSMVFTYREIQNWREDSWAADFLRTLLRTRTVVFCGYSVQDPVVHDTFRTVYEEMARLRSEGGAVNAKAPVVGEKPETASDKAPAFFFARRTEFHGLAVLQAASEAVGAVPADFGQHPNLIQFYFPSEPEFPHLDELFRWLFHLFFRFRQKECLETDLRRISTLLLGGPRREAELKQVAASFGTLLDRERAMAAGWTTELGCRYELDEVTAWTESFQVGLLREFSASEVLHRRQGPGIELGLLRRFPWYYPAMQDAGWTAWGAVVELALRRMLAALGKTDPLEAASSSLHPARCHQPTVLYQPRDHSARPDPGLRIDSPSILSHDSGSKPRDGKRTPWAVTIHLAGFQKRERVAKIQGHAVRRTFWELSPGDAPWARDTEDEAERIKGPQIRTQTMKERVMQAPPASVLWRWATELTDSNEDPEEWLWPETTPAGAMREARP